MSQGAGEGEGDDRAQSLDPIATVQGWRERGAARADPVGFCVIEALARRAAVQQGDARRRLIVRVEELLAQQAVAKLSTRQAASVPTENQARRAVLAGLSELVDRLGRSSRSSSLHVLAPSSPEAGRRNNGSSSAPPSHTAAASRDAVTAFQGTWVRLRTEQRLRQALAQVPAMAGPLNSSHVVNRTLQTMRDLSPEYLDAFMQHMDTLLWLEQASGGAALTPRTAPSTEGRRGPGARAPRKV